MFKQKLLFTALLAMLLLMTVNLPADEGEKHPEVDFTINCMDCHQQETPDAVNDWRKSAHGQMNFGCYMCHGDGSVEFYPSPGSERCISCHSGQDVDFSKTKLDNCFDCHQGHSLKFHH